MTSSLFGMTQPPVGFGPGSQPSDLDGEGLNYMPMPKDMEVYASHTPEVDDPSKVTQGIACLDTLCAGLGRGADTAEPFGLSLDGLGGDDRKLVNEALGEGEVSAVVVLPDARIEIQEATLAGVWRVCTHERGGRRSERIEVASFPRVAFERAFSDQPANIAAAVSAPPPGVINACSLLTEVDHRSRAWRTGDVPHVINMSLLPHSPEDSAFLDGTLGKGTTTILSRGYGNCRLTATALRNVWWVRYYNSVDTLILDTLEITDIPAVACAAPEDIADSAVRLSEIIDAIR